MIEKVLIALASLEEANGNDVVANELREIDTTLDADEIAEIIYGTYN